MARPGSPSVQHLLPRKGSGAGFGTMPPVATDQAPPTATAWTYAELVAVAMIWGTGSVAIKIAVEGFPPLTAAGLRLALASAIYVPWLWLNSREVRPPP